eukprot:TRINITY_DN2484_c0_g1_i5.p1 TRINITY_DN2484_c0_g1~~TRINITY_DN2484_c0_g1_i5.p1  ORF type:complete len:261 (+),score=63.06 TRINITY_DN2484_c0_g1_i5:747-1529(+)
MRQRNLREQLKPQSGRRPWDFESEICRQPLKRFKRQESTSESFDQMIKIKPNPIPLTRIPSRPTKPYSWIHKVANEQKENKPVYGSLDQVKVAKSLVFSDPKHVPSINLAERQKRSAFEVSKEVMEDLEADKENINPKGKKQRLSSAGKRTPLAELPIPAPDEENDENYFVIEMESNASVEEQKIEANFVAEMIHPASPIRKEEKLLSVGEGDGNELASTIHQTDLKPTRGNYYMRNLSTITEISGDSRRSSKPGSFGIN